jgi:hypothetical protein
MRVYAPILLALVLAACGGDEDPQGPSSTIYGTYVVETMDGESLPFAVIEVPDLTVEAVAASYTLNSDMTWTIDYTLRETRLGEVTIEELTDGGTYVVNSGVLTLTDHDGEDYPGTLSGTTLTVELAGFVWVAVK